MIKYVSLLILMFLPLAACAGDQTQAKIDAQVCDKMKAAQYKLDKLYVNIIEKYAKDAVFIKNLEASQDAWVKYRDAEIKLIYPNEYLRTYGSVVRTCGCVEGDRLAEDRIKELEQWANGSKDICAGTRMGPQTGSSR